MFTEIVDTLQIEDIKKKKHKEAVEPNTPC